MKAIQVTCPQCGARLRAGDAARVTCEYCGTEAHVQRRSVLRPVPRVRVPDGARVAMQVYSASWASIGVVLGAIVLCGVGVTCIVKRAVEQAKSQASTTGRAPGRILEWEGTSGGYGLLADADGDGDLDVIGRCREVGNADRVTLIALDGATGKTIWESQKLGTYIETYQGLLALAGDTLVFTDERAHLSGFGVRDGKQTFLAAQQERIAQLCAGDATTVIAIGTDDVRRPFHVADGTTATEPEASAHPQAPAPCAPLPHDHDGGDLASIRTDARYELLNPLGLSTGDQVTGPTGARVLAGRRAKGTGVPTLVAIDEHDAERWRADVPAEPLAAAEGKPELVAVGEDLVCASYDLNETKARPHVVCFGLADGARRWDVELLDDAPLEGLMITSLGVQISMWGLLEVRDPADGKLRWKYGGR